MLVLSTWTYLGVPATGLSPVITISNADTDAQVVQTAMIALTSMPGTYKYNFSAYDVSLNYIIQADAGINLVDCRYLYATGANEQDMAQNVWSLVAGGSQTYSQIIKLILQFLQGRWKVYDNAGTPQMVFYDTDKSTPVATFNLLDANGIGSLVDILERYPV